MQLKEAKLLYELDYNARATLAELNKKTGISKQNLNHKIKAFEKKGIIEKYVSVIDLHRLGYLTYRAYIRLGKVTAKEIEKIKQELVNQPQVLWLAEIAGTWDFEIVFMARNYIAFSKLFEQLRRNLGERLVKYNISLSIVNLHYPKDYLLNFKRKAGEVALYGNEPKEKSIDELDKNILVKLSENCRRSNQQIGETLGISYHTIRSRLGRMEKEGIIQSYRTKLNIQKLGYKHMKAAFCFYPHSEDKEKEIIRFAASLPNVTYVVKVLGEWEFEIEAEVEDETQFLMILREIRNAYPEVINDYYTFEVLRELKLNYFPMSEIIKK